MLKKEYPVELLPRKLNKCPLVDDSSMFVRLLSEFPYNYLENRDFLPKITDVILAPNGILEIYSLSLYIYGEYNEKHFNLVVTDKNYLLDWDGREEIENVPFEIKNRFAVFLKAKNLNHIPVPFDDDLYFIDFEHKPVRSNFWHFELFVTKNGVGDHIPRKKGAARKCIAEKIKDDILYFAAKEAKDKFFELYNSMI